MALIRLRVCAGWSEPLLVAHTTLLEISCRGSYTSAAQKSEYDQEISQSHTAVQPTAPRAPTVARHQEDN